jgi:hypothetical protein
MVLALVVGLVLLARVPAQDVHILSYLIPHPKLLHFHRLGLLALDSVIANPHCRRIVTMYRCLWLGVPHIG